VHSKHNVKGRGAHGVSSCKLGALMLLNEKPPLQRRRLKRREYVTGLTTFEKNQPTLNEARIAKNYLNEKELRVMGQLVSGYLDFAERQAEREIPMTMSDWAKHLDGILTSTGEQLLIGNGSISHNQAMEKAETEYKKYRVRTISDVEQDYLDCIGELKDFSKQ